MIFKVTTNVSPDGVVIREKNTKYLFHEGSGKFIALEGYLKLKFSKEQLDRLKKGKFVEIYVSGFVRYDIEVIDIIYI